MDLATANERKQGEAKAYSIEKIMEALTKIDSKLFEAIVASGADPEIVIARAFKGLPTSSGKIGQ